MNTNTTTHRKLAKAITLWVMNTTCTSTLHHSFYLDHVNIGNFCSPGQTANNRWINNNGAVKIDGSLMNPNPKILYYWNSSQGSDYDPGTISNVFNPINNATLYSCISAPAYRPLEAAEQAKPDLQIYPNPFTDRLTLHSNSHPLTDISLYNLHGQLVFQKNQLNLNEQVVLHLQGLPAGIYMLSVQQNGHQNVYKVVKQ
ncbi:MAG: T9SS type A sorting domain-containing protein [Thermaurantimonas sp.]|uniref:T9SS type A sorting domain-containing protein n=1 Tax=Thermaurantimonas sp. TaxID=2681568 RepID=UPI00391B6D78